MGKKKGKKTGSGGGDGGGQGDGPGKPQPPAGGQPKAGPSGDAGGKAQAGPPQKTGQQGQGDGRGQQQQAGQGRGGQGEQQSGDTRGRRGFGRGGPPQGAGGRPQPPGQVPQQQTGGPPGIPGQPQGWGVQPPPQQGQQQFPQGQPQFPQGQGPPPQRGGQRGPPPGAQAPQWPAVGPPPGVPQQQWPQGPPAGMPQQQRQQGPPPGVPPQQWQQGPPARMPQQQAPPPGVPPQQRQQGPPAGMPQQQRQQGGPQQSQQGGSQPQPMGGAPSGGQQQQRGGPSAGPQPQSQRGPQKPSPPQVGQSEPQSGDVKQLSAKMGQLALMSDKNLVSKVRQMPGKNGRIIKVESNHLDLNLGKLRVAYHYDVDIVPDTPKKFMRPVVEEFRKKFFPKMNPAFDGRKNLYSVSPLPDNLSSEIKIVDEDNREKTFRVQVKYANEVDMTPLHDFLKSPVTPQEALQVVDIVLRMAPVSSCYPVGRSFFVKPPQMMDLGEGMEMYQGFYQSAVRAWRPLLNVDVAHKAFPQNICVVDSLAQLLSGPRQELRREDLQRDLGSWQLQILEKFIRTLRVLYEIPGVAGSKRHYRVNGLGGPCSTASFEHEGRRMTIDQYFKTVKRFTLKYPHLPTLWVGPPTRADRILLPLELCRIVEGQGVNRKMTENQTSKMIKYAATNTDIRKQKIMNGVRKANYNSHPCVKEFGFSVGSQFQKLDARVLAPPQIQYAQRSVRVSKGVWRSEQFVAPVTIKNWTMVSVCPRYGPRSDDFRRMAQMFQQCARDVGMVFASPPKEPFRNIECKRGYPEVEQFFKSQKDENFDVIFVVVPDSGQQYSWVKKAAELVVGCLTQCVKSATVGRKMNGQTASNILLKVNSKLNGTNHKFAPNFRPPILTRPVMIMGADVTHPGPDSREIPSVAAVTASHDSNAFQYNICWRLQNPKVEIISDLEQITTEHLNFFHGKTKRTPEAIVFFRDGVSEGQFEQVKNEEIRAIRSACKKFKGGAFEPKITFLVVQKRHHTRLFPMDERDSEDRNKNVPAGTCVDTDITHPFLQDFYLVSHASIQGVAKPTKYCTLFDDNHMDNDTIEQLTYYLCHMFSRCTRSVSYPAPTYYAHLAAARAKVYIENDRLDMNHLQTEAQRFEIKTEIRKGLPMFFV